MSRVGMFIVWYFKSRNELAIYQKLSPLTLQVISAQVQQEGNISGFTILQIFYKNLSTLKIAVFIHVASPLLTSVII